MREPALAPVGPWVMAQTTSATRERQQDPKRTRPARGPTLGRRPRLDALIRTPGASYTEKPIFCSLAAG